MIEHNLLFITLGYIGSCMIGGMLIPQVILTIRTNKTKDLSIGFLLMNMIAVSSMIPYSLYFNLIPVLIANSSVGICNSILLYYALCNYYSEKKNIENNITNENPNDCHGEITKEVLDTIEIGNMTI